MCIRDRCCTTLLQTGASAVSAAEVGGVSAQSETQIEVQTETQTETQTEKSEEELIEETVADPELALMAVSYTHLDVYKRQGVLRPAAYVYGDNNLDPEKYLYVCSGYPSCDSYIGAHKKSMRPMGTMADSNLRNKRIEAHRALDAIWKNGYMTKHSTYIWLQNRLNLREKDTHIGKFSYYLCEQTIRECTDYIKSREEKKKSPDKISVA